MPTPPYRIETPRLVLRCWDPADAPLLEAAVEDSLDELKLWMPWAHQQLDLDERIRLLRVFRGQFDQDQDFIYGIFSPDETTVLGGSGLHTRVGDDAFEIGYWIRSGHTGHGLATEAAAALTKAAFLTSDADRVEIHVDPNNKASCKVAENLGFESVVTLRRRLPPVTDGGPKADAAIFELRIERFAASPAFSLADPMAAFDAAGRQLELG